MLVSGRMDTSAALILCHVFIFFYEEFCFSCLAESSPSRRIQKQPVPELVPLSTREGPATELGSSFKLLHNLWLFRANILVWVDL